MRFVSFVSSRLPYTVGNSLQDAFQEHATLQLFLRPDDGDVTASLTQEEVMNMLPLNTDKNLFTPIGC